MIEIPRLEGFLTTEETATRLGTSKQNVHKMIQAGQITGVRSIGTGKPIYVIPCDSVEAAALKQPSNEDLLADLV